jgi:hypothetical protein
MHWSSREERFEGIAAELAERVAAILDELGLAEADLRPNERLVRHYVQLGILERPERRGREAFFGYRQLVEFLAARTLIRDGWPLAKVAQFNRSAELSQLIELLPQLPDRNPAQELVARFQRGKNDSGSRTPPRPRPSAASPKVLKRSARLTQARISRREALEVLGETPHTADRIALIRLNLTPWCHVYIDPEVLRQQAPSTPELLGKALTQRLIDERLRTGEKK